MVFVLFACGEDEEPYMDTEIEVDNFSMYSTPCIESLLVDKYTNQAVFKITDHGDLSGLNSCLNEPLEVDFDEFFLTVVRFDSNTYPIARGQRLFKEDHHRLRYEPDIGISDSYIWNALFFFHPSRTLLPV